jgi:hypothetical protein
MNPKDKIKKVYEGYKLPDFKKVNKEFELAGIETDKWDFLNSLCRATNGKLQKLISFVTPFFVPGGYYGGIIVNTLNDKKVTQEARDVYKELMVWYHRSLKAEMLSEKEQIVFFNEFWKKYPKMKKETLRLLQICEDVFLGKHDNKKKKSGAYLG